MECQRSRLTAKQNGHSLWQTTTPRPTLVVFKKLFRPAPAADTRMEYAQSKLDTSIRAEYMEQVLNQLQRFGVPQGMVAVEVGESGLSPEGQPMFHAMLKLVSWHRKPGVRLLLGLPLLEYNIRKALETSWLGDISKFSGLWLQPSAVLEKEGAAAEIRSMIIALESIGAESGGAMPDPGGTSQSGAA